MHTILLLLAAFFFNRFSLLPSVRLFKQTDCNFTRHEHEPFILRSFIDTHTPVCCHYSEPKYRNVEKSSDFWRKGGHSASIKLFTQYWSVSSFYSSTVLTVHSNAGVEKENQIQISSDSAGIPRNDRPPCPLTNEWLELANETLFVCPFSTGCSRHGSDGFEFDACHRARDVDTISKGATQSSSKSEIRWS